jgi:hypothetical protein
MFKPIVVNIGTHTGRKNEILAGNHTWIGARRDVRWEEFTDNGVKQFHKQPWELILASFVDVDEAQARKIVLADNRTGDKSTYDDALLADIFAQMKTDGSSLAGTGYKPEEVEDLLANATKVAESALAATEAMLADEEEREAEEEYAGSFEGAPLGEEGELAGEEPVQEPYRDAGVEKESDELKGVFQLKEIDISTFDGIGEMGIPRLRTDRLASLNDFPYEKLETWAGSATIPRGDDPETWWWYNWATGKTNHIKDLSHVIIGFYSHDPYFENWWWYTERYVTKVLNSGIKILSTPDWSMGGDIKLVERLWQLYRSRCLGRYFQEVGLKVIPNVSWADGEEEFLRKYVLATLPVKLPLICIQMQTITKETMDNPDEYIRYMDIIFETLLPEAAILYASKRGQELLTKVNTQSAKIVVLETAHNILDASGVRKSKKATI